MNPTPIITLDTDPEYEDTIIVRVDRDDAGWMITGDHGWSFGFADTGVAPKVGSVARFYGRGIGFVVRGLVIDGQVIFYRTPDEDRQRHAQWVRDLDAGKRRRFAEQEADLDRRVAALPTVFTKRIERFRRNNPDFRWEWEAYELVICETAVLLAQAYILPHQIEINASLPFAALKANIPDLDDGLSGNQFDLAVRLAKVYRDNPLLVPAQHAGMCPIVGCRESGCQPKESAHD